MTYPEAIKYLDSFIDYEKLPQYPYKQSLKIERIRSFLETINNPQDDLKCIHIAGTKGKGSTCAFIAYILRENKFKVGLYTSPHLSDFRERIRILNPRIENRESKIEFEGIISCEELSALVERLKPEIEKYNLQSKYDTLSFFEIYTALAFMYFREKKVDFAVLETGLGGRLDATNTIDSLIAAITPISYEHTQQLGATLIEIAQEKVAIIKKGKPEIFAVGGSDLGRKNKNLIVIVSPQEKEVMEVIRNRCREQDAILYEIGKDVIFEKEEFHRDHQCFNINGALGSLTDLKIRLLGRHQIINATLAVAAVSALNKYYQVDLRLEGIRNGLYSANWPGRFEIITDRPVVVLDGAQNRASAQALRETLTEFFPDKQIILVLGISRDKDIQGIAQAIIPISHKVILTQADNPRAADVDVIEEVVGSRKQETRNKIFKIRRAEDAIELAKKKARPEDLILVTGSLFLIGQVRDLFRNKEC